MVLLVSKVMRQYSLVLLLGVGAVLTGVWALLRTQKGHYFFDWLMIKIPIFGGLMLQIATVRFTRALATLLTSGIQILQSLKISARLCGNLVLTKVLNDTHDAVEEGHSLSQQLESANLFPVFMTQLIAVGEESGEIVRFLKLIGNYYEERIDTFLARLSALLEPLLLVFVGSIIGVIVVSIFLPLLEVSTRAGS